MLESDYDKWLNIQLLLWKYTMASNMPKNVLLMLQMKINQGQNARGELCNL